MDTEFVDARDRSRYELVVDGEVVGFIVYRLSEHAIVLVHTEVGEAHSGKGYASTLARSALDDARARGLRVVPSCPYVRAWIAKHPDYADLVRQAD